MVNICLNLFFLDNAANLTKEEDLWTRLLTNKIYGKLTHLLEPISK